MTHGNYKNRRIEFDNFLVSKFSPNLFNSAHEMCGCGSTALATICPNINPYDIRDYKNPKSWKDKFMISFLKDRGYKILPITFCSVCNDPYYVDNPITKNHVILISQLLMRNEATWSVIYKDFIFHNFSITKLTPLEFINNPILTAYLVTHDDWKL